MAKTMFTLDELVGKTVIIGLNYARSDGTLLDRYQLHGRIVSADSEGISVMDREGKEAYLPPAAHAFVTARPGTYRLRATEEEVVDPDLETIWTIWDPGTDEEWWEVVSGRDA